MFFKSTGLICPKCHSEIILYSAFCRCKCGLFPKQIIDSRNNIISAYIRNIEIPFEIDVKQQHFYWSVMKRANRRMLTHRTPKCIKIARDFKRLYFLQTIGTGDKESLLDSLRTKHISISGDHLIVANIVAFDYISGFWIVTENETYYHGFFPGGVALGNTLKTQKTYYMVNNYIFVFQNIRTAVEYIRSGYMDAGIVLPIIAHPTFDILDDLTWLPNKKFVLLSDEYTPELYYKLLPLDPLYVDLNRIKYRRKSIYNLMMYVKTSEPLKNILKKPIQLDSKRTLLIKDNAWYSKSTGARLLNADVIIDKIQKYKGKLFYGGVVKINDKDIRFIVKNKNNFFEKLSKLCQKHNEFLIAYNKKFQEKIFNIACERSDKIKIKEIKDFGYKGETFLFPNLKINYGKVQKLEAPCIKNVPGWNYKEPDFNPINLDNIGKNQILAITFLLSMISVTTLADKKIVAYIITKDKEAIRKLAKLFGIPIIKEDKLKKYDWPVLYENLSEENIAKVNKPSILFNERVSHNEIKYINDNNHLLLTKIDQITDELIDENTAVNLCVRLCMRLSTVWALREPSKKTMRYIYKMIRFTIPEMGKYMTRLITKKILFYPAKNELLKNKPPKVIK